MNSHEPRQTRSAQRDAAREKARQMRESRARIDRTKSLTLKLVAIIGGLAVVALVIVGVMNAQQTSQNKNAVPANVTFNGGIKIGTGLKAFTSSQTPAPNPTASSSANGTVPNIVMYVDYQCPICQTFEKTNSEQLRSWVNNGVATLEIHPISFLDGRGSPNTYSSRAANAALCVASYSPNNYFDFSTALFANQPAEGTPGPENPALVQRAKDSGVINADKITECINNKTYGSWLTKATGKIIAPNAKVPGTNVVFQGTPTVVVNGQQYPLTQESLTSAAMFAQWFLQVTKG